jgi:hypothetical protein
MIEVLPLHDEPPAPSASQPLILLRTIDHRTPLQLTGTGLVLVESLLVLPYGDGTDLTRHLNAHGPRVERFHPRFGANELHYLRTVILRELRRLLESRLTETEAQVPETRRTAILQEMRAVKHYLSSPAFEAHRRPIVELSDLIDIVITRAMASYPVDIVEVTALGD